MSEAIEVKGKSVLEDAVKKILNKCRQEGLYITKALAHYVARTQMNSKTNLLYGEEAVDPSMTEELVK